MSFFKKIFFTLLAFSIISPSFSLAGEVLPTVYLYHLETCPHCQAERAFLVDLKKEIPDLEVVEYEVSSENKENQEKFVQELNRFGINTISVPFTVIGDQYVLGFDTPETTGKEIRDIIEQKTVQNENVFKVPVWGSLNIKDASLPFLTVILGTLDGFNPCSMWALLVLLTMVLASGSRKKVWLVGGVFILTSSLSYFLFMAAWFNAFILLDYLVVTRIIVGAVALVAGFVSIKEFYTFKPNTCEVSSPEQQKKTMTRIEKVLSSATLPALILGVIGIAFSVNLVELFCSLGVPVIFTKALAMHQTTGLGYYLYILGYVFFYMLDDIIVVAIAGYTMKFFDLDSKYSRWSRLGAGILMLVLGLIFIVKPELLSFK